jgi:hypothetical protein
MVDFEMPSDETALGVHDNEAVPSCPDDGGLGCGRGSRFTIAPLVLSDVGRVVVTVAAPDHAFLFLYGHDAKEGGLGWAARIVREDAADDDTGGGQRSG